MTHVAAFRISVNPLPRPARLDGLARPAWQGLMLAALMLLLFSGAAIVCMLNDGLSRAAIIQRFGNGWDHMLWLDFRKRRQRERGQ